MRSAVLLLMFSIWHYKIIDTLIFNNIIRYTKIIPSLGYSNSIIVLKTSL